MLVTFGIKPSKPETGYGYVKTKGKLGSGGVLKVERFVEKPDKETAVRFCAEPGYFWNSGIFLFGAKAFLDELGRFEPDMVRQTVDASSNATKDLNFIRLAPANSGNAAPIPSTTRSWKRRRRQHSCPSTRAGATSEPGMRFTMPPKRTRPATPRAAIRCCKTPRAAMCAPRAAWWR